MTRVQHALVKVCLALVALALMFAFAQAVVQINEGCTTLSGCEVAP